MTYIDDVRKELAETANYLRETARICRASRRRRDTTMDGYFRQTLEHMKTAAAEMQAANAAALQSAEHSRRAFDALKEAVDHVLHAKDEHEDLRDTVHRLEATVIELVHEVRTLRENKQ
jgi:methyl-accepting chemotaxis protein